VVELRSRAGTLIAAAAITTSFFGRIPSFRLGGEDGPLRFVPEDIERWLADARGSWLPSRATWPRSDTAPEHSEDAARTAGGSVVPIRGQQSLV
jgi:hypothetical protein